MEAQAGLVPRQTQKSNQPPCLPLKIVDDSLVVHLEEMRGRQSLAPVRHQPLIGSMKASKLGLVVGERLFADEELGVARQPRVDRIAAAVDDLRLRQDDPDHLNLVIGASGVDATILSIPEPSTWAMPATGFLGLAGLGLGRRAR